MRARMKKRNKEKKERSNTMKERLCAKTGRWSGAERAVFEHQGQTSGRVGKGVFWAAIL